MKTLYEIESMSKNLLVDLALKVSPAQKRNQVEKVSKEVLARILFRAQNEGRLVFAE